jgi:hypothetical protein
MHRGCLQFAQVAKIKGDTAAIIFAGVKIVQKSKNWSNENKTEPAIFW